MRLSDLLTEETIQISLVNQDKSNVILELLDLAMKSGHIKNRDAALKAVLEREKLMSTGLEKGIALPHAKCDEVDELTLVLAIEKNGIDFESADEQPSRLFFFLLAPTSAAGPNVQVLAQIARLTGNISFCEKLLSASSSSEVLEIIKKAEN